MRTLAPAMWPRLRTLLLAAFLVGALPMYALPGSATHPAAAGAADASHALTSAPVVSINCNVTSASPATVAPGGTETFLTSVTASQQIVGALVSFEVYNTAGVKLVQTASNPL